jgi:tRNA dimethylallyltransferase
VTAIADIVRRGKRVLVVGGTGLYVKVLRGGLFAGPSRDPQLRQQLEQDEAANPGTLHRRLTEVDPGTAARLHPHDRVRLIRALEVHALTGQPISAWQQQHAFNSDDLDVRVVALALPRAELYQRIDARCHAMVDAGLIDEVRSLFAAGYAPTLAALQSPGYREIGDHVRGVCDLPIALARMAQATRRLAKRQLTWFRGDSGVFWCAPDLAQLERAAAICWSATE